MDLFVCSRSDFSKVLPVYNSSKYKNVVVIDPLDIAREINKNVADMDGVMEDDALVFCINKDIRSKINLLVKKKLTAVILFTRNDRTTAVLDILKAEYSDHESWLV